MKRFLLVIIVLAVVSAYSFAQAKPGVGEVGIQGSMVFTQISSGTGSFGAKMFVSDNLAVRAALGILSYASGGLGSTLLDAAAAVEFHFGGKGNVSPYAGGELSYSSESFTGVTGGPSNFGVAGFLGGEYFFSSNFSWAGEIRLGFESQSSGATTSTYLGTFGFASFVTWYLN